MHLSPLVTGLMMLLFLAGNIPALMTTDRIATLRTRVYVALITNTAVTLVLLMDAYKLGETSCCWWDPIQHTVPAEWRVTVASLGCDVGWVACAIFLNCCYWFLRSQWNPHPLNETLD